MLADWALEHQLSRKTTAALNKEECNSMEALKLVTADDINRMEVPVGQIRLLREAVRTLGNPITVVDPPALIPPPVPTRTQDKEPLDPEGGPSVDPNVEALRLAGLALLAANQAKDGEEGDALHAEEEAAGGGPGKGGTPPTSLPAVPGGGPHVGAYHWSGSGGEDPLLILTAKSLTNRALKIVDFLLEPAKSRVSRSRREQVTFSSMGNGGIALKAEESSHYYISIEEWVGANMRLMAQLITTGALAQTKVLYYVAYTTMIADLAVTSDWQSVLQFDSRYRELQADRQFAWGTRLSHEQQQHVRPKASPQPPKQKGGKASKAHTSYSSDDICRQFAARGQCMFGDQCKFRHGSPGNGESKKD